MTFSVQKIASLTCEIQSCHNSLLQLLSPHYPELQTIGLSALEYAKVCQALCNETSLDHLNIPLATCMSISLLTVKKQNLSQIKEPVNSLMFKIQKLYDEKAILERDMANEITQLAPNLSMLLSTETCSELLAAVEGSLLRLSRLPASTLQSIKSNIASASQKLILANCKLVLEQPKDFQQKAQRLLAAKAALCARLDQEKSHLNGSKGLEMRQEIEAKLAQLQEAKPLKEKKPLPAPIDRAIKRRGGKRAKKKKALLRLTQVRKLQNRLEFGKPEAEIIVGDDVEGLGMLMGREDSLPKADLSLRESIKKLASKNKVYSAFKHHTEPETLLINVGEVGKKEQKNEPPKSRWFN